MPVLQALGPGMDINSTYEQNKITISEPAAPLNLSLPLLNHTRDYFRLEGPFER
jgi:hypothetical protein